MKKSQIIQKQILEHLIAHHEYSYADIMKDFGISERTMQYYISSLVDQGNDIRGGSNGSKSYMLLSKPQNFYEHSSTQNMRRFYIMNIIASSNEGFSVDLSGRRAIARLLYSGVPKLNENSDSYKVVDDDLKKMTADGELSIVGNKYVVNDNAPIQLRLTYPQADRILSMIDSTAKGHACENDLRDIAARLSAAIEEDNTDSEDLNTLYGGSVKMPEEVSDSLERLNSLPYMGKLLDIDYVTAEGSTSSVRLAVGVIIYSVPKKSLYIIGEQEGRKMIINAARIQKISTVDEINHIYKSKEYLEIADEMFAISIEEAFHAVISFDNVYSVSEKIEQYCSSRKTARIISKTDNEIILEDTIRGADDLLHWLRRFGASARILEPAFLADRMRETVNNMAIAYGEDPDGQ